MGLTKEQKKAAIDAKRGPLEHEQYSASLDVKTAKASKDPDAVKGPQERLDGVEAQLAALDAEEKKL